MRVLYAAIDQAVPAAHGGSVHVTAVAEGLADLGHEVEVLVSPGSAPLPQGGRVRWTVMPPPFGSRRLRLLRAPAVTKRALAFRPHVLIERYYNFGGEGLIAARRAGALAVLEVNAPVADHPGSAKGVFDRLTLVEPLRRWREWQCRTADLIVTPSARILPPQVPASRILQTEWGADTDRFRPDVPPAPLLAKSPGDTVFVFAGAFRAWHGAAHLIEAVRHLQSRGRAGVKAILIGDGPEHERVRRLAANLDGVTFTGAMAHADVPSWLAGADVGVAPFDLAAHPALAHEFHWSPLKVFEYMASGLPVVMPAIARLADVVRHEREGLLYDPGKPHALAESLERLTDPSLRAVLGSAARVRAVDRFSWKSHCAALDRAFRAALVSH